MVVTRSFQAALLGALLLLAGAVAGCDVVRGVATDPIPACTHCHGGELSDDGAPPRDLQGRSAGPAVGAHQAHLHDGPVARAVACAECHVVPTDRAHAAGTGSVVSLATAPDRLASAGGVSAAWSGGRCSVYCHGASLTGGTDPSPRWDDGAAASTCGACHGLPPTTHGTAAAGRCWACHADTVRPDGTLDLAGGKHLDGRVEAQVRCDACHGTPPATGAHARHATRDLAQVGYGDLRLLEDVDPTYASRQADYAFGCGFCHPLDVARHLDGVVEVDLSPAGAPGGSLRAANRADAAYDPASGTCSGVACHSSGQASPAYVDTTAWTGGPNPAGCFGCHGNPPDYPNGGASAADANGHLALKGSGVYAATWGHVRDAHSMPHGWEYDGSYYWVGSGSPRTCQACHFETVDPANTAPGGFMYFDTSVRTLLQISPYSTATTQQECQTCHTGAPGELPAGSGKVLPLRHVNGRRDVVFDQRTSVPPGYGATAAPGLLPVYPYWYNHAFNDFYQYTLPYVTPLTVYTYYGTLSFPLTEATWDPATKSCATVACHYNQAMPGKRIVWGAEMDIPADQGGGCISCHD